MVCSVGSCHTPVDCCSLHVTWLSCRLCCSALFFACQCTCLWFCVASCFMCVCVVLFVFFGRDEAALQQWAQMCVVKRAAAKQMAPGWAPVAFVGVRRSRVPPCVRHCTACNCMILTSAPCGNVGVQCNGFEVLPSWATGGICGMLNLMRAYCTGVCDAVVTL